MDQIRKKVIAIVAENLEVSQDDITESHHFFNDLGADSLDAVELLMAVEEAFGMLIPESEREELGTVGDLIAYVEAHKR